MILYDLEKCGSLYGAERRVKVIFSQANKGRNGKESCTSSEFPIVPHIRSIEPIGINHLGLEYMRYQYLVIN